MHDPQSTASPFRVLVTGAAGGIGAEVVRRLHARGAEVAAADVDLAALRHLGEALPGVWTIPLDVADQGSVDRAFAAIDGRWSEWDALAHCPGIGSTTPFLEVTDEMWRRIVEVNLNGAFRCMTSAARRFAARGRGSIVALSSVAAQRASSSTAPYAASKGALELLCTGLAMELGPAGVRVNCIAPGPTNTDLAKALHTGDRRARFLERVPLGRYAEPGEIAAAAAFLLSDDASFVTGQVLVIDGGMSIANVLASHEGVGVR